MKVEEIEINKIIPYANNPRQNDQAVSTVAASIKEFGFRQPIVTDETMTILVGHTRLKAAQSLGLSVVPVHIAEGLTEAQKKAYRVADNRLNDLAEWDKELLSLELEALTDADFDLGLLGFSDEELDELLAGSTGTEGNTEPDDVPDVGDIPVTKQGDVWLCGNHRIMCGDSTSVDTVETVMPGEKAEMIFTDPPYRMEAEGGSKQPVGRAAAKLGAAIAHLCDFDPVAFLNILPTCFNKGRMNAYIFCNKDLVPDYLSFAKDSGYSFNILFWKKPNAIPLGGQHRPDVEYLLTFRKSATFNNAIKGVSYSKCLEHARENSTPHPTMKPVALIENQILISSSHGGIVLDLFGGSGSTLIACEKTGRKACLLEIDPKYCDVIIKRWQAFTGKKAILEGTGEEFEAIAGASISDETVIK